MISFFKLIDAIEMTTAFDIQFHAASPVSAKVEIFFKVYMNILTIVNENS